MSSQSPLEQLPVEVFSLCMEELPLKSLAVLLGLSRQTRAMVLTSIEFMFNTLMKSLRDNDKYLGLEATHTSLSATEKSRLKFSDYVALASITTRHHQSLRFARFEIETPVDITRIHKNGPILFTCSVFRQSTDIPYQNYFEDIVVLSPKGPIIVDRDGLLIYPTPPQDSRTRLTTVDINPFKVIAQEIALKRLSPLARQAIS